MLAAVGVAVVLRGHRRRRLDDDAPPPATAPAPEVVVRQVPAPEQQPQDLGFPAFATKNTTRVAGADPAADAAGGRARGLPVHGRGAGPGRGLAGRRREWPAGIAAATLVAAPVGAPVLITAGDSSRRHDLGARAARAEGLGRDGRTPGVRDRRRGRPDGLQTLRGERQGAGRDRRGDRALRERLGGEPDHSVVASSDEPAYAMPAAAWAARSGDPVLFASTDSVPKPTLRRARATTTGPGLRARARRRRSRDKTLKDDPEGRAGRHAGRRRRTRSRTRSSSRATRRDLRLERQRPRPRVRDRRLATAAGRRRPRRRCRRAATWGPLLVNDDAATAARRAPQLPPRPQARLRRATRPAPSTTTSG